jgi:alkaline phosphatase
MIRPTRAALTIAALALPLGGCVIQAGDTYATPRTASAPAAAPAPAPKKAKNVILFIGDGMGISTITAARIYAGQKRGQTGEENVLSFERFENVALVKTYNADAQVPDSAGTATAIHSGKKTNIGVLGVGPEAIRGQCATGLANPLPLLGEEVKAKGKALGIVSTARITHATPASVYARIADRNWEADAAIREDQKGRGCKDIATQLVEADWDLALGGGSIAFFGANKGGGRIDDDADLAASWRARTGGTYVTDRAGLEAAPMGKPVLGLFTKSHMTYSAERTEGMAEPSLTELTAQAIERLSADPDGYYLMVEAGRIDHAHHAGQAGYALEDTVELDRAVRYAIENTDPEETLIMVTADHSHVFTIAGYPRRGNDILGLVVPPAAGGEDGDASDDPALASDGKPYTTLGYGNGPGSIANMATRPVPATGIKALQQSTVPLGSETHGGEDVALYARGPGAQRVRGVIEQNLIYDFIRRAFGWE